MIRLRWRPLVLMSHLSTESCMMWPVTSNLSHGAESQSRPECPLTMPDDSSVSGDKIIIWINDWNLELELVASALLQWVTLFWRSHYNSWRSSIKEMTQSLTSSLSHAAASSLCLQHRDCSESSQRLTLQWVTQHAALFCRVSSVQWSQYSAEARGRWVMSLRL